MNDQEAIGTSGDGEARTFSLSNPVDDPLCWNVPKRLRRVADELDGRPRARVLDLTFHSVLTESEGDMTVTVYYYEADDEEIAREQDLRPG